MKLKDIQAATSRITAPGQPYEVIESLVDGVRHRLFRNAPTSLAQLYRESSAYGEKTFYVYQQERYSFIQTWQTALKVAGALKNAGVQPGDRVGIAMRNYPEWIFSFMGITSLGAVAVALNAWWGGEELEYGIKDSGLKLLFLDDERLKRIQLLDPIPDITLVTVRTPSAETDPRVRSETWQEFLCKAPSDVTVLQRSEPMPETPATLFYTSGSTAHPKGVLSTHRSIVHALLGWECAAVIAVDLNPELSEENPEFEPAMILTVPLFHITGLNVQFLSSLRPGRKLVGMYKWDREQALAIIEEERITQFNGVPTMSWELIHSPNFQSYDLRSLKSLGGGGAAMAPEHARQISEQLKGAVAGTGYGMTETNGLGTVISGEDLLTRPASCGRPVPPMVSIQVVGPEGEILEAGLTGEIWIKGSMNFSCYWNNPKATLETLSDGWVHSGDIGYMDADGFVFITDRAKDMVIRGGENIGCQEVEAVIYEIPGVLECAVFGVPDERLGETLAAVVMLERDTEISEEELQRQLSKHLARFKIPDHIWFQHTQLPRIASGKIFKRGLQSEAIRKLNGDKAESEYDA